MTTKPPVKAHGETFLVTLDVVTGIGLMLALTAVDYFVVIPSALYLSGMPWTLLFGVGNWVPLFSTLYVGLRSRRTVSLIFFLIPVVLVSTIYAEVIFGIVYTRPEQGFGVPLVWSIAYFVASFVVMAYRYWECKWQTRRPDGPE